MTSFDMSEVDVKLILDDVVVVKLSVENCFHENASWMLQTVLSTSTKADKCYDYIEDKEITRACVQAGYSADELGIARIRHKALDDVKVVGTTGKKSIMLASVLSIVLAEPKELSSGVQSLQTDLEKLGLAAPFEKLVQMAIQDDESGSDADGSYQYNNKSESTFSYRNSYHKDSGANNDCSHKSRGREDDNRTAGTSATLAEDDRAVLREHGVDFTIVADDVAVIEVDKSSVFNENASWLLQTAMKVSGKAMSQFEYVNDAYISSALRRVSIDPTQCMIAKVTKKGLEHIKAVGASGKRSVMIAVVAALAVHGALDLVSFGKELKDYSMILRDAVKALLRTARQGRTDDAGWLNEDAPAPVQRCTMDRSRSRDRATGNSSWGTSASSWWQEPSSSWGSFKGVEQWKRKKTFAEEKADLDKQLEDYWKRASK